MAKIPKDSPDKVGQRVALRGKPSHGTITEIYPNGTWVRIEWDDGGKPKLCHIAELVNLEHSK